MRYIRTPKSIRYQFASLQELQRWIEDTPRTWSTRSSVRDTPSKSWDLKAGYEGALEYARDGWQQGAATIAQGLARLPAIDNEPDWRYDVAGYLPDVGRFCAGMPDNMVHFNSDDFGAKPIITLAVPVNALGMVSGEHMSNFGLAIARYVDELEAGGYRVEVHGVICSQLRSDRVCHSWIVKEAHHAMNLASVAFSLGHPAMFRRLGFALRERTPVATVPGYGQSIDVRLSDLIDPTPGTIILNGMKDAASIARTPANALEHVRKQIDRAFEDFEAESHGY